MPASQRPAAALTLGAGELRRSFGPRLRDGELGALAGRPLLVVELDDGPDLSALLGSLPCVVVGVAATDAALDPGAPGDVLLADRPDPPRPWVGDAPRWLLRLEEACTAAPMAAVALVQLLRLSAALEVTDGLVAESFAYSALQSGPEHARWLSSRRRPPPAGDTGAAVLTERLGATLSVTLNRPGRHNAYSASMRDGLVSALQLAHADPAIERVELAGAGPSFCSGGDLSEFGTSPDPVTAHAVRVAAGAASWMHRCAARTAVRVHGACAGAGVELASFAGSVTAEPGAWFSLPEVSMGLVPGAGGTVSVPRRIGRQRAALLALSGAAIDAATALDWGLIDRVEPPGPGRAGSVGAQRR